MAAGLVFLVCAVAVLYSTEAQDSYDGLPDIYKKGVDLTMQQLSNHTNVQHHYRFFKTVKSLEHEDVFHVKYVFHHVYLKPTRCAKGTTEPDPQRCPYRRDRPLMDCVICYKAIEGQIKNEPSPYIHCIQKPRLTEMMKQARLQHYRQMFYHTGSPSLLSRTSR